MTVADLIPPTEPFDPAGFADWLKDFVFTADARSPRSMQKRIGPSEVGEPCVRRLAYRISDWPKVHTARDPWSAIQGTAVHGWLADQIGKLDPEQKRFIPEARVEVRKGYTDDATVAGSTDLFDLQTRTVIDWKVCGTSSLDGYRRTGPGVQYETQAHLYGLGWANAGMPPSSVAIVFLARHHEWRVHVWSAPWNRRHAENALTRLDSIRTTVLALDPEAHPGNWTLLPTSDEGHCSWCPYFKPGSQDLAQGCPGSAKQQAANSRSGSSGFTGLI